MKVFNLPDLGEGLPDAEIVEWLVEEGDAVELDQPLVSMETAKAVVEVPSPFSGKVVKFHGQAGDVIQTGAPLAEFKVDGEEDEPEPASSEPEAKPAEAAAGIGTDDVSETEPTPAPAPSEPVAAARPAAEPKREAEPKAEPAAEERADTGTVVGNVQSSNEVLSERTSTVGGVKVTPAVRALARKLKVDVSAVQPTGSDGVVTAADVRQAAASGSAPAQPRPAAARPEAPAAAPEAPAARQATPAPAPTRPAPAAPSGDWEPIRGTRRTMARVMSESHKSVVPTTLMDDADIHAWAPGEDITARLLRALWAGAQAEPGLNAWYDGDNSMRMVHKNMHVGMAVDTPDGLFVAALRNVNKADRGQLRAEINRLRENATNRSIPPEDLKDYTIILSNFGKFAGRYATPVITPPCVAIVAAGALRHEVVPVLGGVEVHRMIPLSLTFDHRACTGGEAARFLKAMLDDLARAN
ncbi:dihydrolipoamide acetyltransferase family protein [Wenzhouxiangella marina]|uniref:Dihydrolipoamide acetyltransferase component of pyruvate dehydrogenase complex n=1 Tax=Wenzhouxiangella marina TaxID=1579979 RepID=A0A0K0XWZ8_9GAMM|nr:dihydrolipoamide acetyltransferase family protein [Wenzhouxiangella marina]AKS42172.1 Branched-chain alpha-keto acid dehydrogenase subunit E2 [Wenzhouxiangella marina]MBB6086056.1 pyruvate dehydrogenase E2 component (dihydrolipoamide acetyltransferase) [Wenzhouxiangella marina]